RRGRCGGGERGRSRRGSGRLASRRWLPGGRAGEPAPPTVSGGAGLTGPGHAGSRHGGSPPRFTAETRGTTVGKPRRPRAKLVRWSASAIHGGDSRKRRRDRQAATGRVVTRFCCQVAVFASRSLYPSASINPSSCAGFEG